MVVIDVYRDEAKFKSEALKVVENIRKLKGNINIDLIKSGRPAPAALASYIFIALCCYPHVKLEIGNLSQITTTAPIFLQFNYFRENIWVTL